MSTRVSLVDRLDKDKQQLDPNVEAAFMKGGDVPRHPHETSTNDADRREVSIGVDTVSEPASRLKEPVAMMPGLIAVNVRIRPELARALKTASLDRQIQGIQPYSKREIVEEALEPWLRSQGYLAINAETRRNTRITSLAAGAPPAAVVNSRTTLSSEARADTPEDKMKG